MVRYRHRGGRICSGAHAYRLRRAATVLLAILFALACALRAVPPAQADTTATAEDASVGMSIDTSTSVVTATSGYHLKVTITNPTAQTLSAGTLRVSTNIFYSFVSRTDIQEWSQGQSPIPTADQLGQTDVPAIGGHSSADVSLDVPADQDRLKAIVNWGPKPLLIRYAHDDLAPVDVHTFITRSGDGLSSANTPAMKITVAMPLAGNSWQLDPTAATELMTGRQNNTIPDVGSVVTLGNTGSRLARDNEQVISKHPQLQVIADPTYLKALPLPIAANGIMQPGYFDITAASAVDDTQAYDAAGAGAESWNAASAQRQYQTAVGDNNANQRAYAWQGDGHWTMKALTEAKAQGYDTVVADQGFDDDDATTVHTGKYVVPTSGGDVTVLAAQRELTSLARGKATSRHADGEGSAAGRLARFMAQSAFYQMEQPYTTRNLLVCFDTSTPADDEDALMKAIEHAPWLELTDLNDLSQAEAYRSGESTADMVPETSGLSGATVRNTSDALQQLASSRADISRFATDILAEDKTGGNQGSDADAGDAQSLAQHNADAKRSKDGKAWIARISEVHDQLALHTLSVNSTRRTDTINETVNLSKQLLSGVTITPMEKITVVSETASMPVTISNLHPYPVTVKVSSITDSMEIVTNRFATVEVPARGNTQVTFTIRVSTSGTTTAHLTLFDRQGKAFSSPQETPIISSLQISDMSGFIFVAVAILLGVLGLWRQFHRKKDPDE